MAANGQNLFVSAYDGEHGDLVVHTFDKADLTKPQKTQWLDGVPATGHIGGDVNGPRGGITDPGPNVGQYTSIAASPTGNRFAIPVNLFDAMRVVLSKAPPCPDTSPP